jgi:hypothetical protein
MMDGHVRSVIAVTTSEPYTRAERDGSSVARDPGGLVAFGQEQASRSRWTSFRGADQVGPGPHIVRQREHPRGCHRRLERRNAGVILVGFNFYPVEKWPRIRPARLTVHISVRQRSTSEAKGDQT